LQNGKVFVYKPDAEHTRPDRPWAVSRLVNIDPTTSVVIIEYYTRRVRQQITGAKSSLVISGAAREKANAR